MRKLVLTAPTAATPAAMAEVEMSAEEIAAFPVPLPPRVPDITRRQLLLALLERGIEESQVDDAIAAFPDGKARAQARIEWRYSTTYQRQHPLIEQLGVQLLGVGGEALDEMFRQAAQIP